MGRWLVRLTFVSALAGAMVIGELAFASESQLARLPIEIGVDTEFAATVVVQDGDHLWKISAAHLRSRTGSPPSSTEVSPYWRTVIAENTPHLRSGDPDLIYPGELITLPEG